MKVMKAVKIGSRKNKVGAKKTGMTTRIRRADPYTESWYEIVKKVKRRAGNACEKCGSTDRLEVHHLVPVARGGRNNLLNLRLLCHCCHCKMPGHTHMH